MITLDFSNVKGNVVLEEGTYEVTIIKAEEKRSSSGKPNLLVVFEESTTKAHILESYGLSETALWKLQELLKAAGIPTEGACELNPADLLGVTFKAKVVQDEYNGDTRNKIKKIYAA